MFIPAALLCLLFALLFEPVQSRARVMLERNPVLLWLVAGSLSALFCAAAYVQRCLSTPLAALIFAYTLLPAGLIYLQRQAPKIPSRVDLLAILLLWLPLEFSVGARLIPRNAQGVLHATAYGIAVTLGVCFFVLFRHWPDTRYKLPGALTDVPNALIGYAVSALVLIPLGLWTGFLNPFHSMHVSAARALVRLLVIFFATGFPEEILFRALLQNWFVQTFKSEWKGLAAGAVIFGAAHLDNGPPPLPNWRYAVVATLAGVIFGAVFLRSKSVLASAAVHAGADATKHFFF